PLGPLEPEKCSKPRDDVTFIDAIDRQQVLVLLYLQYDIVTFHTADDTLKIPPAFIGHAQPDFGLLANIASELLKREQGTVHSRRRHFQRVVTTDGVLNVQHRTGLTADCRAGFDTDAVGMVDIDSQQTVTPLRQKFDPPTTIAQSFDNRDQQVLQFGNFAGQFHRLSLMNKKWA